MLCVVEYENSSQPKNPTQVRDLQCHPVVLFCTAPNRKQDSLHLSFLPPSLPPPSIRLARSPCRCLRTRGCRGRRPPDTSGRTAFCGPQKKREKRDFCLAVHCLLLSFNLDKRRHLSLSLHCEKSSVHSCPKRKLAN